MKGTEYSRDGGARTLSIWKSQGLEFISIHLIPTIIGMYLLLPLRIQDHANKTQQINDSLTSFLLLVYRNLSQYTSLYQYPPFTLSLLLFIWSDTISSLESCRTLKYKNLLVEESVIDNLFHISRDQILRIPTIYQILPKISPFLLVS